VLVIDGKNNNDDGMSIGKNNKEQWHDYWQSVQSKLRRNNTELHAERKCASGPRLIPLPKLRRDSILRNAYETQIHQDSQNL
jgi:hypothetical protein